jgi:hypothetical protein
MTFMLRVALSNIPLDLHVAGEHDVAVGGRIQIERV